VRTQAALDEVSRAPATPAIEPGVFEDAVIAHVMSGSFSEVSRRETGATSAAHPFRVLLGQYDVDDRAELRRVLAADPRLEICSEAADAPASIAATLRRLPDICLLDVALPGGGVEAAWEISARLPGTKVVLRTDDYDDEELYAALRAGACGYLRKGSDLARLPEVLMRVMAGEAAIPRIMVSRMVQALRTGARRRHVLAASPGDEPLTSREWQVLDLLCQNLSTAEIADALTISKDTVRSHVSAILRKLQVPDRAAAVELCSRP
jgi:DNA-binding NarL/FixJ family response regulator